ncbi:MAG: DUF721 domain-containing protein [Alphaproteobacteria bacterium]|nr:DUF721 domain-containing protein [Alphaproteobacteria bacterium]
MTRSALAKRGFAAARVIADWPEIVGAALAQSSVPERLVRARGLDAATLVVRVSPGAALELQHAMPQVIERVNGYFGFRAVDRLRLVQGPVKLRQRPAVPTPVPLGPAAEQALETTLAPLANSPLHDSLAQLGRAVAGRAGTRPVARSNNRWITRPKPPGGLDSS